MWRKTTRMKLYEVFRIRSKENIFAETICGRQSLAIPYHICVCMYEWKEQSLPTEIEMMRGRFSVVSTKNCSWKV